MLARAADGVPASVLRAELGHTPGLLSVSLAVPPGALTVVMGLSGSGKSTLLRCINRLVTPVAGQVRVADRDVTTLSPAALRQFRRETTAMVFQHFGLLPRRNALENVAFPLRIQGRSRAEAGAAARTWLDRLGLAAMTDVPVEALSTGMRQRVGLARALVSGAPVLLMDEPFGALDPITRRAVQDELKDLQRDLRKTVVLITHDPREAFRLADHLVVIRDGRVIQAAAPEVLRSAPADPHVRALLASADL
jgi:glycine betaine/proline transport system ATP-binding protein